MQLVDAGADEREQRGEQRDRGGDGDRDGGRSAPREPGEEAEPHEQQAEQRDHHGDSCEDDRTAGSAHRFVDRVEHARPSRERSPVARDDEQRVVDADADADHRGDLTGEVRSVDERRPQGDCRERDEDAGDRGCDRESHRDHRAERQQQDHDRSEEADELGCRQVALLERVASEGNLDRCVLGDLLHRGHGVRADRDECVVRSEVDRCKRDVSVGGEPRGVVERRRHVRDAGHGRDLRDERPDRVLVRRGVEIGVGLEDHDGRLVALCGQVGAHEVVGRLHVGAVQASVRDLLRVDSAGHDGERDRRHEPEDEGATTVRRTGVGNSFNHAFDDEGGRLSRPIRGPGV